MKRKGTFIGLSLLLAVFAFLLRDWFLTFFTAEIVGDSLLFNGSWRLPNQIFPTIIFVFSFGVIPFLYLFVKNYCKISSTKKQLLSLLIIIASGVIGCGMRVIYLKYEIAQIRDLLRRAELTVDGDIPGIGFQDMHLESYLLAGLLVGSLLCMIVFRTTLNRQNGEPNVKC